MAARKLFPVHCVGERPRDETVVERSRLEGDMHPSQSDAILLTPDGAATRFDAVSGVLVQYRRQVAKAFFWKKNNC